MKKFMVVCEADGEQWSKSFDKKSDADQYKMDCECGIGGYAEVYQYNEKKENYEFMYA